jgi:hypothetical protein
MVNYLWSNILDQLRMQGNPVTIVGDAAQVDEEDLTNEPGSIIKASDINQVRREPGVPITPGAQNILQEAMGLLDKVQGLQDVSRGAETSNVNSALMMEGYIEAAQTRPRMKNRNLDAFLQDAGELILQMILQFYTQPRVFRITNKQGYPEFIEFYIPVNENGQKTAKITKISTQGNGVPIPGPQQSVEVKGMPDVRVISGSALPYAKAQKAAAALTYFNSHAIDQEELLKSVDWPNYEEVLRRMAQAAQQQAQMEAQMPQKK